LIFENHIKFHKIPGMSEEAKTYDETLDELEKLLEKEEKEATPLNPRAESYVKRGFKIKRMPVTTPSVEDVAVIEPNVAPSYLVPSDADTIPRTSVSVKTMDDRAREKKEQLHQNRLQQIAKEKMEELLRKKEIERKQLEEEERR